MDLTKRAEELRRLGQRRFATWNDAAFDWFLERPVQALVDNLSWLDEKPPDDVTLENFLQLVCEGIGTGWLRPIQPDGTSHTFLAYSLTALVPYQLGRVARNERGEALRRVWNLGEGLAREPQWLNQYAIARTEWGSEIGTLDRHLAEILAPVLSPQPAATWRGTQQLHILNLRESRDEFVPGRMYLASPAVLCVEDRMTAGETIAILLQKPGKSEILGPVTRLPEYAESFSQPSIRTEADSIAINGQSVAAPLLSSPRQAVCVSSGFVVVSADDSQRLWLVESS